MEYVIGGFTDKGPRKNNEDRYCCYHYQDGGLEAAFAVVCDGVGGMEHGGRASDMLVSAFRHWAEDHIQDLFEKYDDCLDIMDEWMGIVDEVNESLLEKAEEEKSCSGTTVTALLLYDDRYCILNVGDSRAYEIGKDVRQLTDDDSLVAKEVAMGRLTEEEAARDPRRNVLLQCVGTPDLQQSFYDGKVEAPSLFIICTDGFYHELSPEMMRGFLYPPAMRGRKDIESALDDLSGMARLSGEQDNITAVAIAVR